MGSTARNRVESYLGAGILLALAGAPTSAWAWRSLEMLWHPDDLPVAQCTAPDEHCPDNLPSGYCLEALEEAHLTWTKAEPCLPDGALVTECEPIDCPSAHTAPGPDGTCANLGLTLADPRSSVGFGDPHNELHAGVLSATMNRRGDIAFVLHGRTHHWIEQVDIVFNSDVALVTHQEALDPGCTDDFSLDRLLLHELGHLYGLGHSCDFGEPCTPSLEQSVMFWAADSCATPIALTFDDLAGIGGIYGPKVSVDCDGITDWPHFAPAPLQLDCTVVALEETTLDHATWTLEPSGEQAVGATFTKILDAEGTYGLQVLAEGSMTCGDDGAPRPLAWRQDDFVTVCEEPGLTFTWSPVAARTFLVSNQTALGPLGCVHDILWEVYEGDTPEGAPLTALTSSSWAPLLEFPGDGTYTVVANLGWVGGTVAAMGVIEVQGTEPAPPGGEAPRPGAPPASEDGSCGCQTTGPHGLGALLGLLAVGLGRRRSRRP